MLVPSNDRKLCSVLLLALALAPASASAEAAGDGDDDDVVTVVAGTVAPRSRPLRFTVEAPFTVYASPGVDTGRLDAFPALGVRAGGLGKVWGDVVLGADLGLHVARDTQGAVALNFQRNLLLTTTRLLVGYDLLDTRALRVTPLAFGELMGGGGLATVSASDTGRTHFLFSWAVRAGVGLLVTALGASARVDVAAGIRDLRQEIAGSLALGWTF